MDWDRLSDGVWESQGYRIAAAWANNAWNYCAFAPALSETEHEARLKIEYAIGESVPLRREQLGCFTDPEAARMACADHLTKSFSPPEVG